MRYLLAVALVFSMSIGSGQPRAATISIVAFGDSNVHGSGNNGAGVPVSEAYPAKIERALRARVGCLDIEPGHPQRNGS
jgi:hypothetical protein